MRVLEQCTTVDETLWSIEQYTFFNGTLHLKGFACNKARTIAGMNFVLADGRAFPILQWGKPSPELTRRYGRAGANCRFDEHLSIGLDITVLLTAALHVLFADGGVYEIPLPQADATDQSGAFLERFLAILADKPEGHMLEVGSRARVSTLGRSVLPAGWRYTGFDVLDGPNVDVVGDAHRASQFLPKCSFDAVVSFAVFEHLLMPWKAAIEVNKLLKIGAVGIILAPQTWSLHEEPCDYFRFSRHSWKALFNRATGFEIIETASNGRAYIVPHNFTAASMFGEIHTGALMTGVIFRKVAETTLDWPVGMDEVSDDLYPF